MTSPQAIFASAVLIVLTLVLVSPLRSATAMSSGVGQYQLMNHSNTTSNVGIFRMDTMTGEISFCYLTGSVDLVCTKYVK